MGYVFIPEKIITLFTVVEICFCWIGVSLHTVHDMDWLPCLGEFSNHFCFYYVGSLIMNHKYIGNDFFGLSVQDDRIVDHQLTEEDIILCDQAEKLLYTAMKQLMPTSYDVN